MKTEIFKYKGKRVDNGEFITGQIWDMPLRYGSRLMIYLHDGDEDTADTGWKEVSRDSVEIVAPPPSKEVNRIRKYCDCTIPETTFENHNCCVKCKKVIDWSAFSDIRKALQWALSELEPLNDQTKQLEQINQQLPMAKQALIDYENKLSKEVKSAEEILRKHSNVDADSFAHFYDALTAMEEYAQQFQSTPISQELKEYLIRHFERQIKISKKELQDKIDKADGANRNDITEYWIGRANLERKWIERNERFLTELSTLNTPLTWKQKK